MLSYNSIVESPWVNPITICIGICVVLFISFGIQFGESIVTITQQIFLPYFLDISKGIGKQGALAFRGIVLIIQLGVIGLVIARSNSNEKNARAALSTFGILLVLVYFILIAVGYILPRLH